MARFINSVCCLRHRHKPPNPIPISAAPISVIDKLPVELLIHINKYLRYADAVALKHTCRLFFQVIEPGPRPRVPRTVKAWGPEPVICKIVLLGWRPIGVLNSLHWGIDGLDMYDETIDFDHRKELGVDGQDVKMDFLAPPQELLLLALLESSISEADGIIVVYNLLSRGTYDAALSRCRKLRTKFDSEELEVPILLLGVNIHNRDWTNTEIGKQEASKAASDLQVPYCEARLGQLYQDENDMKPIDEPFIDMARMIRQAVEDYMEMKNHKTLAGAKRSKKLRKRAFRM